MKSIICEIMENFAEPFVSEADFQFCLAWEMQKKLQKEVSIILEFPVIVDNKKIYVDLCVIYKNVRYYIELKYKTKKMSFNRYGKAVSLEEQSAADLGRYSFVKDVGRLESLSAKEQCKGICVLLTNEKTYKEKRKESYLDKNFCIAENNTIVAGLKKWNVSNAEKKHWTEKYTPINIGKQYNCKWTDCNNMNQSIKDEKLKFAYLLLSIE